MKRLSKQTNRWSSQFIIALFVLLDVVIASKVKIEPTNDTNQISQQDLSKQTASILSNYHSDAENILRNTDNLEKKSNAEQTTPNPANGKLNKAKFETELKIVKRSPRNYNFGLGKRSNKPEQLNDDQIKELLNYLYNLDLNLILNYINNLVGDEGQQVDSTHKFASQLVDDDQDEKYKAKRDIQGEDILIPSRFQQQRFQTNLDKKATGNRLYNFGVGKRFSMGDPRLEEYMKRRYSFGIGKRSTN